MFARKKKTDCNLREANTGARYSNYTKIFLFTLYPLETAHNFNHCDFLPSGFKGKHLCYLYPTTFFYLVGK